MAELWMALAAFVGTHFLLSHPLRAPMASAMGETGFAGVYSIVALGTFAWVIMAFRAAPVGDYAWMAGDWAWGFASLIMLFASILLIGSFGPNPALPSPGGPARPIPEVRGVLAITRHPMNWSFALWGIAHAIVGPQPKVLVLCGAIAFLAIVGSIGQDSKKEKLRGEDWRTWERRTAFIPFAGQLAGRIPWRAASPGGVPLLGGLLLWLAATWAHPMLGAPVAGIWRWLAL